MKTIIKLFLLIILISSCRKDCIEREGRFIELKIVNQSNENITNEFEIDSILIRDIDCNQPGFDGSLGYPLEHRDSTLFYNLTYCCGKDSIKYWISKNKFQNVIDSFIIYVNDLDPGCDGCSIISSKSLSENDEFYLKNDTIRIQIKD